MGMVWRRDGIPGKSAPKVGWREAFRAPYLTDPTTLLLLAANLLPLLGVLLLDWDHPLLLMLYWSETGIIGFWHVLRMVIVTKWLALFLVPFFVVHFGIFMTAHFSFLQAFFTRGRWGKVQDLSDLVLGILVPSGLWIPFLALFLSHGVSFFLNFFRWKRFPSGSGTPSEPPLPDLLPLLHRILEVQKKDLQARKEGRTLDPEGPDRQEIRGSTKAISFHLQGLMLEPYQRIMVMHMTIILGGITAMVFHDQDWVYILLVFLKVGVDVGAHARKNFKAGGVVSFFP